MLADCFRKVGLSLLIVTLATLTFLSFGLNAEAKDDTENKPSQSVESYLRYMPSRHEYGAPGKVAIIESDTEYSYEFKAFDKLPVKLSVDNNYIGIETTPGTLELPAHLVGVTTDIEATLPFFNFNKSYFRMGISPSFFGDNWNFRPSTFRIPSRYLFIYQPDAKWTFLAGVAYYPDFEYDVFPIGGFIYKPNDKLIFEITPERPNITYWFNDRIALFVESDVTFGEFTVTRDNLKNITLQYREAHLGSGVKLKLNQYIQAYISAGRTFNRYFKYTDSQGKVDIKNGLYAQFRVEIRP